MNTQPTPWTISVLLRKAGFAEYDGDNMGCHVFKAAFGPETIVELRGVDLLPFNAGEGPRALLDDYAAAIRAAGYGVRMAGSDVIVTATAQED